MPPAETQQAGDGVAVQLAHLTGRIDQVISDHERRLLALESRATSGGARTAAILSPTFAGVALLVAIAGRLQWA